MFRVSAALSRTTMEAGAGEGSSMPETSWQCLQTVYKRNSTFVQDTSTQETAGIAWPYWPHNISQDLVGKKQSTFNSVLEELLRA